MLKPIWDNKELYTGNGLPSSVPTIILPCDLIALVERLHILMASKAAGNTGIRNELVSVCDELLRQNLIDKQKYKTIMLAHQDYGNLLFQDLQMIKFSPMGIMIIMLK